MAFYLPQFHPIPENNQWWGEGFTEWRNVTRALPQFEGHAQPRLPADLGFYDLRNKDTMRAQAALARQYGISAFCSYFYWFGGQTLLEAPLQNWLNDRSINMPLCLCWANETWSRRWDGRDQDALIEQRHSPEDDLAFISHIACYLRDPRYLRVDGKPLLLVYRPSLFPDARATADRWRMWCEKNGVGSIKIAYVQSFERPDPRDIGFDAAVEFPPNMGAPRSIAEEQILINDSYEGDILDWRTLAAEAKKRQPANYLLYPGVNPGWDNEPRRPGRGRVYKHASPRAYRDWLREVIHCRLAKAPTHDRLVFINAWNEWAEGAILEPDQRLGHAWLDATRQALQTDGPRTPAPYAIVHTRSAVSLRELIPVLQASQSEWRLLVTTTAREERAIRFSLDEAQLNAEIHIFEAHQGALLPFLQLADRLVDLNADFALNLNLEPPANMAHHTWKDHLKSGALLDKGQILRTTDAFHKNPDLGLVAPDASPAQIPTRNSSTTNMIIDALRRASGLSPLNVVDTPSLSEHSFWVRFSALRPLLDAGLTPEAFHTPHKQTDERLTNALIAFIPEVVRTAGFHVRSVSSLAETKES